MLSRKLLLRVVFVSLGMAAFFGAVGVIFAGHDTLWRIVGTCALTALGALGLLGATPLVDAPSTRSAGLLAVALIATEFLLGLALVWELFAGETGARVGISMTVLGGTGAVAVAFFALRGNPRTAVAARAGIAVCVASFFVYEVGVWAESLWNGRTARWVELGNSIGGFGLLATFCLVGAGTDRRHWRYLGVAASAVALLMSVYGIVFDLREASPLFVCVFCAAAVATHANLVAQSPLAPRERWLLRATIGSGIATGFFVGLGSVTAPWQEEPIGRLAGAAAILGGCGTLALLVLARIRTQRRETSPDTVEAIAPSEIVVECPRCRRRQSIPLGPASCAGCGLRIEVRIG